MRATRQVVYSVTEEGYLRRAVSISDGRGYTHHCSLGVYEQVAHAFEDGQGHTLMELAQMLDQPYTQVNVAIEFLKERGCVVVRHGRRSYAASGFVLEDALVEYHALRERPAED